MVKTTEYIKLRDTLARLYLDKAGAQRIVTQAGIDPTRVPFSDTSLVTWSGIIENAYTQNLLIPLIEEAISEFPTNETLKEVLGVLKAGGKILELRIKSVPPATIRAQAAARLREAPDELRRIKATNQDWVVTTRSFHFQRLLQAIEEVEHPSGRLEAGRALNLAVRRNRAASSPTGRGLLSVCDELDSNSIFQLNWKLHRILARVIGDVIGLQLGRQNQRIVGRFCESRLDTREGVLLLAEAAVEHTAAALAIGAPILRRLLLSTQPQAPWQLLRRWPLISPVLLDEIDLNDVLQVRNACIRRMLLVTQLQRARDSHTALKNLLGGIAGGFSGEPADLRLYRALTAWAALYTTVDLSGHGAWRGPFFKIDDILKAAFSSGRKVDDQTGDLAQALELDSIERDLSNAEGVYQPHPKERYSEGRYSYTRYYVRRAFRVVPRDQIGVLLIELLHCADEGIRWAMAAEVLNWWTLVPDADVAMNSVLRLVRDEHPWVVREVLQQLATDPLLCQAIGIDRLTLNAAESRRRAQEEGWITSELAVAIGRIAALDPIRVR